MNIPLPNRTSVVNSLNYEGIAGRVAVFTTFLTVTDRVTVTD